MKYDRAPEAHDSGWLGQSPKTHLAASEAHVR